MQTHVVGRELHTLKSSPALGFDSSAFLKGDLGSLATPLPERTSGSRQI